jgi:hypothetical protein
MERRDGTETRPICGKNVPCRVVIELRSDDLRICFQDGLLESKQLGGALYDLARELADFCENGSRSHLIGRVLHEGESQQIEELLTKDVVGPGEEKRYQVRSGSSLHQPKNQDG